jgi:hypothetical protein
MYSSLENMGDQLPYPASVQYLVTLTPERQHIDVTSIHCQIHLGDIDNFKYTIESPTLRVYGVRVRPCCLHAWKVRMPKPSFSVFCALAQGLLKGDAPERQAARKFERDKVKGLKRDHHKASATAVSSPTKIAHLRPSQPETVMHCLVLD